MLRVYWIGMALLLAINLPAYAFSTVDEQIDHYLNVFNSGEHNAKITMLKRLQWSGISNPRLYNRFEQQVRLLGMHRPSTINKPDQELLAHQIRALGYSGIDRYRHILASVMDYSKNKKLRNHAKKALVQLDQFKRWNQLIADSNFSIEGKSVEVTTYMKMLSTDHVMVQRLAARAIFHEKRGDPDLLAMAVKKLEGLYLRPGLDAEAQDTAAWLCKAIGENGDPKYSWILHKVVRGTPYKKVRDHASKYTY